MKKMKSTIKKGLLMTIFGTLIFACSDFEEINVNPTAATADQVQIEYFINNSIISAQQDPHIAERVFVLYWKAAGRMDRINSLPVGYTSDGWSSDYFNYISGWLNHASTAIQIADEKIEKGNVQPYTNNLKQVARIWRVYLMSEMSDNFGPIAINGFQGENPDFNSVQEVYYHMLAELREAVAEMEEDVSVPANVANLDPAYGYDFEKWTAYANSLRMRLAMRLSEVDPDKAQEEFEDAVTTGVFINSLDGNFKVAEKPGWDALTGVMSREWNNQYLSPTLNNLMIGLGGISSEELLEDELHQYIKPENYLGLRLEDHFTTLTTNPTAGFWLDGLPAEIDPRAYQAYVIPGNFDDPEMNRYPSWDLNATGNTVRDLVDDQGNIVLELDAAFTWNAPSIGSWGEKGSKNQIYSWPGALPRLAHRFRNSTAERIFFASWESHFLIAEAAIRGWNVPMDGKTAYEEGIRQSMEYWEVSEYAPQYIASEEYNLAGTSVNWDHTVEPSSISMDYVDGYTGTEGNINYEYPDNHLYMDGNVKNDHLTKIITQKFIAQVPWLPLETWSDHRRLGLPYFETPAVENPLSDMPQLTEGNFEELKWEFFPQRLKYPSNLANNVPEGYSQALNYLGGEDSVFTPLWWAAQN